MSEVLVRVRAKERELVEALLASRGLEAVAQPREGVAPALMVLDPAAAGDKGVERAAAAHPGTPAVLLCGPQDRVALAELLAVPTVAGVVARDVAEARRELDDALALVTGGLRWGLGARECADAPSWGRALASSVAREALLEEAQEFLLAHGVRRRMVELAVAAIEELITNAVYDAPTDLEGRRLYAAVDRRSAVFLAEGSQPRLELAVDGAQVVAAMTDPFGSLDVATVRRFLAMGLRGDVSDKAGGAGLGFARIFGLVDRLRVQIAPRERTEIAFSLNAGQVRRDPAARPTGFLAWGA